MKILLVHNAYQQLGGEDAVVSNELKLLKDRGHPVELYSVSNDRIRTFGDAVSAAWGTAYSNRSRRDLSRYLRSHVPELVHVHNFFPLLSPSIYDACRENSIPVVQTLHNFRTICAGGLLLRDGEPCEDCIEGSPYQGFLHGCYRNSRAASLPVARMIARHAKRGTWNEKVDRFIALSQFAKSRFVAAGFPESRIVVKPNFVEDRGASEVASGPREKFALYVGRLSEEKGVRTLVQAWQNLDVPLRVMGDGPLASEIAHVASKHVTLLGSCSAEDVAREMARASVLIVPSECYEGFPVVLAEAFCQGLPVIAARLGSLAELVEEGVTGLFFTPRRPEELARRVSELFEDQALRERLGQAARKCYESLYTPEVNYRQLTQIYESILQD